MELAKSRLDLRRGTWALTESGPLVACPECGHASLLDGAAIDSATVELFTCPLAGCDFDDEVELVEELTPLEPEDALTFGDDVDDEELENVIPIHNTAEPEDEG